MRSRQIAGMASFVLLLAAVDSHFGEGRLTGLVLAKGFPVPGVAVSARLDSDEVRVVTDSAGRFVMFALEPGEWVLSVRRLGYLPYVDSLQVGEGDAGTIVQLTPAVTEVDTVRVIARGTVADRLADFRDHERRARAFGGRVYDRDALHHADEAKLTDFLNRIPGVKVSQLNPIERTVSFARCPNPNPFDLAGRDTVRVFVDGVRVHWEPMEVLSTLSVADVEALEVYQGMSQLPPEVGDGCSAIFVWTRRGPGKRGKSP